MDLRERREGRARHPWELARLDALRRIVRDVALPERARVLDVGCGDGFTGSNLFADRSIGERVGMDANFSDEQLAAFGAGQQAHTGPVTRHVRGFDEIEGQQFDVVLLLDVIEHVTDDVGLLRRVCERHMAQGAVALITVPAVQALFSAHDRFLQHRRRYRHAALLRVAREAGLRPERGGYLFASLLLPRLLGLLWECVRRSRHADGVGNWRHGPAWTWIVRSALGLDNRVLCALAARGVLLPGLSTWVLCRPPRS